MSLFFTYLLIQNDIYELIFYNTNKHNFYQVMFTVDSIKNKLRPQIGSM